MQGHHRQGEPRAWALKVDGDDGLVAQARREFGPRWRQRLAQPRRLGGAAGQHDGIEAPVIDRPAAAADCSRDTRVPVCRRTPCLSNQAAAGCGNSAPSAARGSNRSDEPGPLNNASRITRRKTCALACAAGVFSAATHSGSISCERTGAGSRSHSSATLNESAHRKRLCRPTCSRGQQRQPLAPGPAAPSQHRANEGRHRRSRAKLQTLAIGILQRQRQPLQQRRDVGADLAHQLQRVPVRADQDVLPVVQRMALHLHRARAPARLRRHLEHLHRVAGLARVHCRGDAGPAGADHRDSQRSQWPRQFVRHAIHSLRSGVSEVR